MHLFTEGFEITCYVYASYNVCMEYPMVVTLIIGTPVIDAVEAISRSSKPDHHRPPVIMMFDTMPVGLSSSSTRVVAVLLVCRKILGESPLRWHVIRKPPSTEDVANTGVCEQAKTSVNNEKVDKMPAVKTV